MAGISFIETENILALVATKKRSMGTGDMKLAHCKTYAGVMKYYALKIYVRAKRPKDGKKYNDRAVNDGRGSGLRVDVETWKTTQSQGGKSAALVRTTKTAKKSQSR